MSFGVHVRGDEVEGNVVRLYMREKGRDPHGLRGRRPAYLQARGDGFEGACGMVVELKVSRLLGATGPEIKIRFVPDFELPLSDFVETVAGDKVRGQGAHHVVPKLIVLGRGDNGLVEERLRLARVRGHLARHKAKLDKRPNVVRQQPVVNLVDVGEVIGGGVLCGFGSQAGVLDDAVRIVEPNLIHQDAVEA